MTGTAPDLVERKFVAAAPDQLWVADITYIPTWAGFLYLAVVLDVFSRRIVGWAMANHLRTELIAGPAESFSCVAGTMVQEAFVSSEPIRAACNSSILGNAAALEDDLAAAIDQSGASGVTAASLARHIQAVIQGAFVLAKAGGDAGAAAAAREHLPHLRRYFEMLLTNENTRAD